VSRETSDVSRREFLRTGILGSAGLAALGCRDSLGPTAWAELRAWAQHSDFVPAIVIGSGFGGAVAALRLGQAGISTLVLERGRRWDIRADGNTFATFERPDGRAYWLRDRTAEGVLGLPQLEKPIDRYVGVLEVVVGNGIFVGAGAGVGGGSLVFNAIIVKPRRELFERTVPRGIDFDEMEDVYYPRVQGMIGSAPIPDDILATEYYRSSRVSLDQARTAGFPTRPGDLAVDWDIVRDEIAGRRVPSAIAGHGDRYAVTALHIGDDGAVVDRPRRLTCKYLFLAAGSIGTTSLLVRARATRALPALNDDVGRHWATNGDIPVTRGGLPPTNAGTGGPAGHFIMEDLDNPFGPTSLVELVLPPHIAAALSLFGAPPDFANYASLGIPPANGSFSYDAATDAVRLNWPATGLGNFLAAAQQTLAVLDRSNGSLTLSFNPSVSAHPLGGAVLGKVCDLDGRVQHHRGLYVVDGALIEGATGIANPSFTIAALAERSMDHILAEDHLNDHTP